MIYTRCLAVAEVDAERGNAGIGRCTVLANLEVGTAGTDASTLGGIAELALATHEQDVLVCSVERQVGVCAHEADAGIACSA